MVHAFLDQETMSALDWDACWQAFRPITPYGRAAKADLKPYGPGEEAAWRAANEQLRSDLAAWLEDRTAKVGALLEALPDVREAIDSLRGGAGALAPKHCLALKSFARGGRDISAAGLPSDADVLSDRLWHQLAESFGDPDTPGFSVTHIAGEDYLQAGKAYAKAMHDRSQAVRDRNAALQAETGIAPNREGQLRLEMPRQRELADRLKTSDCVAWLRDTPFESVFAAAESEAMNQAQEQVDATEAQMEAAAQAALHRLTDTLRASLPVWEQAIAAVARLDLRIAKVNLARAWNGCVATEAPWPQLRQGADPTLDAAYRRQGRRYVPIDWALSQSVSVVCGSNMGGKTLAMRLLCTCQALAQYALPVPAQDFATRLYGAIRVCASADTQSESGLSSFGKEMIRLVAVWPLLAGPDPVLACLDEPGRSTNPAEGEALVIGLLQAAGEARNGSAVVVATHFPAAGKLSGVSQYRVRGLSRTELAPTPDPLGRGATHETQLQRLAEAMDYGIEPIASGTDVHEGLCIARWLGVPDAVIDKARHYLDTQTRNDERGRRA